MLRINQHIAILLARLQLGSNMSDDQLKTEFFSFASIGVSFLLPFGTKLHIKRNGAVYYYHLSGYAQEGTDVAQLLASVGYVVEDGGVKQIVSWLPTAPRRDKRFHYLTCNGEKEEVIRKRMVDLMNADRYYEAVGWVRAAKAAQSLECV